MRPTSRPRTHRLLPLAALVLLTPFVPFSTAVAAPGDAPVTGSVFVDFDRDGIADPGEAVADTDPLFPPGGVTVTAHDVLGATSNGTVTPGAPPTYSIDVTGLTGSEVRLEFALTPADETAGWSITFDGASSATDVRFVSAGAIADIGVVPPSQCPTSGTGFEGNANTAAGKIWTTCFVNGLRTDAVGPQDALVGLNYDNSGAVEHLGLKNGGGTAGGGSAAELGSVWGLAYDEWSSTLFTSSFLKRHVDLGAEGVDGLHWITYPGGDWNSISLDTLGGSSYGADPAVRDLGAANAQSHDAEVYPLVAKRGIGDIDVTPNGRLLAATNIDDAAKAVMVYDVAGVPGGGNPVFRGEVAIPNPGCPDSSVNPDDYAIFAITAIDNTQLMVGVTCTAQNSATDRETFPHPDLWAHLVTVDITDPTNPVYEGSVADWPLSYSRGCGWTTYCEDNASFRPWQDVWNPTTNVDNDRVADNQPVLSDIEVLADGSLTVGFIDRMGHQAGSWNWQPDGTDTTRYTHIWAGEMLRLCNTATPTATPSYVVEGASAACPADNWPDATGGSIYSTSYHGGPYVEAEWYGADTLAGNGSGGHNETVMGGLYTPPRGTEIVATVMDPFNLESGGLAWYADDDGTRNDARELYVGSQTQGNFGKSGGLGDVEGCSIPMEVGERVWLDHDGDGIQDPGEPSLAGVTVTLTGGNLPVAGVTTTTDADGRWTFGSADGVQPNQNYTATLDVTTNTTPLPAGLTNADLTETVADTATGGGNDANDSDVTGGVIPISTGSAGRNDHSFDAGYTLPFDVALALVPVAYDQGANRADFEIRVTNQGQTIENLSLIDYLDDPTTGIWRDFNPTLNPAGQAGDLDLDGDGTVEPGSGPTWVWTAADPQQPRLDLTGVVPTGTTITIPITLQLVDGVPAGVPLEHWAEITNFDDGDPGTGDAASGALTDRDSLPDDDRTNDRQPAGAGDTTDDEIGEHGLDASGGDEDDHDVAGIQAALDVALIITYESDTSVDGLSTDRIVTTGDSATFAITITNQGPVTAYDVDAIVYEFAAGTDLQLTGSDAASVTDSGGSPLVDNGDGTFSIARLDAGDSLTIRTTATVLSTLEATQWVWAEIVDAALSPGGATAVDVDSTPDALHENTQGEQTGTRVNNATSQNGKAASPGDEDDHDPSFLEVVSPLAEIGDRVWYDLDHDGIQDAGETGVSGVRVDLLDEDGIVVDTTTTNADGDYLFEDLTPGDYELEFHLPDGWIPTTTDAGANDTLDSDGTPVAGASDRTRTGVTTLVAAESDLSWDQGIFRDDVNLTLDKASNGYDASTRSITWTFTVVNEGPEAATGGFDLTDRLPAALGNATAASGDGWVCTIGDAIVECAHTADLAAGATAPVLTIVTPVDTGAGGPVTNAATIDLRSGGEAITTDNSDSASVTVDAPPSGLAFTGGDASGLAAAGSGLLALGALLVLGNRRRRVDAVTEG